MTKRFVITGCSRSGTRYMSVLLTDIGCECHHDNTFLHPLSFNFKWKMPPYGGASWYIAPKLSKLPKDTIIFHQIRNPLKFIRSRMEKGRVSFYWVRKFMRKPQHSINFYAKLWIKWNKMVEKKANLSYRIEDLSINLLTKILDLIEFSYNEEEVKEIFKKTSKQIHTSGPFNYSITLNDIDIKIRPSLIDYARKFNYWELD